VKLFPATAACGHRGHWSSSRRDAPTDDTDIIKGRCPQPSPALAHRRAFPGPASCPRASRPAGDAASHPRSAYCPKPRLPAL